MDGLSTNLAMCRSLGCSFTLPSDIQSYFISPTNGQKIHVILDACHMIKLIRNMFFAYKILFYNNNPIKWDYLVKLVNYQQKIDMKIANKLTINHIKFQNRKMKVKYATQLFSSSVAKSLELLKDFEEFSVVAETINFIFIINDLFDILNSRTLCSYGWKQAITANNLNKTIDKLFCIKAYLLSLKDINGVNLYKTKR